MAVPAVVFVAVLFVLPIGQFLLGSILDPNLTLKHYRQLADSRAFFVVMQNTLRISVTVTIVCLLLGYPVAFRITTLRPRLAALVLLTIVVSVWISLLVRNYAWMVLLGRQGLLSVALVRLGVIEQNQSYLYNEFAVILAMTHVLLPFMIIPITAAMRAMDPSLVRAAESMGARPFAVLRRVIVPMSLPGTATGCVLVFVLAMGFFVTPAVMGGRGQIMIAMLIEGEINEQLNWGYAAAHAAALFAVTMAIFALYNRKYGLKRLWGGVVK
jgi:ABC-type spermidine/putrescine transport system permease subunit I